MSDYDEMLWNFEEKVPQGKNQGEREEKLQEAWNPSWDQDIKQEFGRLTFPCYAIYRAIGVRLADNEMLGGKYTSAEMNNRRDISRKRGINKYFRCILYYKGDLEKKCAFTNNVARRCNLFVQFFENPSDSFNAPPEPTLVAERKWNAENNGWGKLRPLVFSTPRGAVVDVVQNYEYNLIPAPTGVNSILIPSDTPYPDQQQWEDAFRMLPLEEEQVPPYEWKNLDRDTRRRRAYRLRPLTNLVTNSGLHLFRIEGTGGKWLPFYRKGILHPALRKDEKKYVRELQRLCVLSNEAHKVRFDLLTQGNPAKLVQYPPSLRRFRFGRNEDHLRIDQPFFPIFERCTRAMGLLETKGNEGGPARFRRTNFSYPCVAFEDSFAALLKFPQRENVIRSQIVDYKDYLEKPLFQSLAAREHFREKGKRMGQEAERVLKRNQYSAFMEDLIDQLRRQHRY